jgi:hypothetical protein
MPQDRQYRLSLKRSDDLQRRGKIQSARSLIYEKNYQVNSSAVEKLLKPESLVPTSVCSVIWNEFSGECLLDLRMLFQTD